MDPTRFRFALMFYKEDGSPVGQTPVEVDWEPAIEWTRFTAVRRGLLECDALLRPEIVPLWSERGAPYARGFRVSASREGEALECDFPPAYFKSLARDASSALVANGDLADGEVFRFVPVAFPEQAQAPSPARAFTTEEVAPSFALGPTAIARMRERVVRSDEVDEADLPVFVADVVLDEAIALTRDAGERETGGVLVGHLHRDPDGAGLFVEVAGQIPARNAKGDLKSLSFTPDVWSDVAGILELRGRDEIMVGWWHSHPSRVWCAKCPPENQRVCALARGFFSDHDRRLHRTVFPRAYSVAVVINDASSGVTSSMFGWRHGVLEPRGFHVVLTDHVPRPDRAATATEGHSR